MEFKTRIQKTKSIDLSKNLKEIIRKNGYNKVKWTIHNNKDYVQIEFIKTDTDIQDRITSEVVLLYRNIYGISSISVPKLVFEKLGCKIYDDIILTEIDENIRVTSSEKRRLKELSGLITDWESDIHD